jgi:hypothetical protein
VSVSFIVTLYFSLITKVCNQMQTGLPATHFFLLDATTLCEFWSAQQLHSMNIYPIHSSSNSWSSLSAGPFLQHLPIYSSVFLLVERQMASIYVPNSNISRLFLLTCLGRRRWNICPAFLCWTFLAGVTFTRRGGWPHAQPFTRRTGVCIRFAPLDGLPSLRLWTPI